VRPAARATSFCASVIGEANRGSTESRKGDDAESLKAAEAESRKGAGAEFGGIIAVVVIECGAVGCVACPGVLVGRS
jgi:hypothetical protein